MIAAEIKKAPELADNLIATKIGVNHETVQSVREDLETTCEIRKFDTRIGADGKSRPAKRKAKSGGWQAEKATLLKRLEKEDTDQPTAARDRGISAGSGPQSPPRHTGQCHPGRAPRRSGSARRAPGRRA